VCGLVRTGTDAQGAPLYLLSITNQAMLLFGLYALGVVLAIACTKLLRGTVLRGAVMPLVMELPPYRMPAARVLMIHLWERAWLYIKKAGTIILAIVIVLWAMKTWPGLPADQQAGFEQQRQAARQGGAADGDQRLREIDLNEHRQELSHSAIGQVGNAIAPILRPCGFDWKISTALLGSFAAKEVFVGQMGVIFAVNEHEEGGKTTLRQRLAADYTPLQGLCIMVFVLIASPRMATVAVTARESGSWKWALLQWTYLTALAWVMTTAIYQVGRAMG
jgi:ferrous iron transport protein B